MIGDKIGNIVVCIFVDKILYLKYLVKISGNKKCELIVVDMLEKLIGYICGGCLLIGMKKLFLMFIDNSVELFDIILILVGKRGL